ncbi:storkhead-box protein 2 isoform X2 [Polypterus senegalus]|uniref:storkhead-box protein 2 isoform X2 n=1 Tax=Polypterus senegalus TaxID=55291 RepID=UPI00196559A1|nr:storkhead-box protein 2 isoform X2 [Polypterus senegalus]
MCAMFEKMDKFLQIAPHSLAIVLCRTGGDDLPAASDELQHHHTGYEIFADFKAENMQHFWNKKVTDAVSETFFLGWIDEHVLLIQGKEDHLEVLREGWMRRALKPPRGFEIKYLGDVSPISMSPISQSQFIPLGEILCLAISAMNAARKPVTQEALTEHLTTCFPGVPTPSPEILRHTLNMLVRERKIYPTPEGYFIVTPQTYFITPSLIRTNSKWYHLDERIPDRPQQCTSPQSGTITPSASGCVRERTHHKNHCDSYNCYRDDMHSMHASTLQRKSPKDCKDAYCPPSVYQTAATEKSKSTVNFSYKTDTLSKHKEPGSTGEKQSKKFGLKLFRLSFKKDKTKHLATFSAQFPPVEWPLRDEDTPSTIPREVEMEIIRRINPELTVENVMRHTALMKRLEEEKAQRSKAGSTTQHSGRSKRSRGHRKTHGKSRSHSKTRASKGDPSEGSHLDIAGEREYEFYSSSLVRSPRDGSFSIDRNGDNFFVHSNPNIVESHFPVTPEWDVSGELAKRRTEMPFPEPSRGTSHSKVHRSHSHTQDRKSRNERSSKAKERSRSMDNSKGPLGAASVGTAEDLEGCSPDEGGRYYADDSTLRPSQAHHYQRILLSAANFNAEICMPGADKVSSEDPKVCSPVEHTKLRDSLPAYNELNTCSPKPTSDDYFQCNTSNETVLTAPSPISKHDYDTLTLSDGVKKVCLADRQTPNLIRDSSDYKEDPMKGQHGIIISVPTPETIPNGRLIHQQNTDHPNSGDNRKELFSKDTLFKPPHNVGYVENSYQKSGTLRKSQHMKSAEVLNNCEHFEQPSLLSVSPSASAPPGPDQPTGAQEASFDYYNVSDDDDSDDATHKNAEDEKSREDGGTMQWLLEREKERDLQRKFEKNLTLLSPKETDNNNSQKSAHSARLDSMDSSSITVDSGFNSPRTRESLASNTSSIVESNRRHNPALSPGHGGSSTQAFNFRPTAEPPNAEPEKLQKPSSCLASITSV